MNGWERLSNYVLYNRGTLTRVNDGRAWTVRLYADGHDPAMRELRDVFYRLYRYWHYHNYLEAFRNSYFALDVRITYEEMRQLEAL